MPSDGTVTFEQGLPLPAIRVGVFRLEPRFVGSISVDVDNGGSSHPTLTLEGVETRERLGKDLGAWIEYRFSLRWLAVLELVVNPAFQLLEKYAGLSDDDPAWISARHAFYLALADELSLVVGSESGASLQLTPAPIAILPESSGTYAVNLNDTEFPATFAGQFEIGLDIDPVQLVWFMSTRTALERFGFIQSLADALDMTPADLLRRVPQTRLAAIRSAPALASLEKLLTARFGPVVSNLARSSLGDILIAPERALARALVGPARYEAMAGSMSAVAVFTVSAYLGAYLTVSFQNYLDQIRDVGQWTGVISWSVDSYLLSVAHGHDPELLTMEIRRRRGHRTTISATFGEEARDKLDTAFSVGLLAAEVDLNRYGREGVVKLLNSFVADDSPHELGLAESVSSELHRILLIESRGDFTAVADWRTLGFAPIGLRHFQGRRSAG